MAVSRNVLFWICAFRAFGSASQYWQEVIIPAPLEVNAGGRFGTSISLLGDLLLVGAPGTTSGAPATGAAFLFGRNEGGVNAWNFVHALHLPTPVSGARLGGRVLLVGDRALVSALTDTHLGVRTGSIYVFEKDFGGPGNWGFKQRIRPDTLQEGMRFGSWVRYVNGALIVACPGYDEDLDDALVGVGAIAVYHDDGSGQFVASRFIPGDVLVDEVIARPCVGDWFDVVGDRFVHVEDQGTEAFDPGRAYVIHADSLLDHTLPLPAAHRIVPSNTYGDAFDGLIMTEGAADGDLLVLGMWHPVVPGVHGEYHRGITFANDGPSGLEQLASALPDTAAPYLQFFPFGREGWDVLDLYRGRLLAGALGDSTFTPLGHAEVYNTYDGATTDWTRVGYLQPSDPHLGDRFGATGAVDDKVAIIGAPTHDLLDRGQVYVFLDPTVGVEERMSSEEPMIRAWPDPVSRSSCGLNIAIDAQDPNGTISCCTVDGKEVWRQRAASSMLIPVHDLATGMYVLTWLPGKADGRSGTLRMIVTP